ncbi:MAG: tRNA (adenosine(37)-N6)-threonylcarbamoyltransferase complex dimerization subunit type 1 TsaB [Croceibacterium sp.]
MPPTLAIECATAACSAALFEDGVLVEGRFDVLGRGHAERLVPMIAALPGKGRAARILVSLGPGSFTGVRIGLATARALGLAWGSQVLGYPTLALVAAMARAQRPGEPVSVCTTGGHGEWFVQNFGPDGTPDGELLSLPPRHAAAACHHAIIAGSQAQAAAEILEPGRDVLELLPDARQANLLPEREIVAQLSPIYGRPPDAKLPGASR